MLPDPMILVLSPVPTWLLATLFLSDARLLGGERSIFYRPARSFSEFSDRHSSTLRRPNFMFDRFTDTRIPHFARSPILRCGHEEFLCSCPEFMPVPGLNVRVCCLTIGVSSLFLFMSSALKNVARRHSTFARPPVWLRLLYHRICIKSRCRALFTCWSEPAASAGGRNRDLTRCIFSISSSYVFLLRLWTQSILTNAMLVGILEPHL